MSASLEPRAASDVRAGGSSPVSYVVIPAVPNGDPEVANLLWLAAVKDMARQRGINLAAAFSPPQPAPGSSRAMVSVRLPPDPTPCETAVEFLACMRELRAWAGQPSLHELEQRAFYRGASLPHSTLGRVLSPQRTQLPASGIVTAFVAACDAGRFTNEWLQTWQRILFFAGMPLPEQVRRQRRTGRMAGTARYASSKGLS